ncbi:MAG: hypothetical protein HC824_14585 [Synechococcales cyanobacterium RM1_1_8]|nr:hypothetical protein [Synechococcales cyanobacterium RM1_1_8]
MDRRTTAPGSPNNSENNNSENNPADPWSQARLRRGDRRLQAQQGDLGAVRDWLNQALAQHQVLLHPVPGKNALHLELGVQHGSQAKSVSSQQQVCRWIDQALVALAPLPWREVSLVAYPLTPDQRKATETPLWVARFEIGHCNPTQPRANALTQLTQTKASSIAPCPVPSAPAPSAPSKAAMFPGRGSQPSPISRDGWQALAIGFGLAGLFWKLPLLRLLFSGLVILVHELGHALTYWAFGQPAIPSVNLLFGGGITLSGNQSSILLLLILGGWSYGIYRCRQWPRLAVVLAGGLGLYGLAVLGSWDDSLPVWMGHGFEAGAIAFCLYCCISGQGCRFAFDRTIVDRTIYGLMGWFLWLQGVAFSWGLLTDAGLRSRYGDGIGGLIDNDFVRLADDYWGWPLEAIALLFLLCCLGAPVLAWGLHRSGNWLRRSWVFLRSPVL